MYSIVFQNLLCAKTCKTYSIATNLTNLMKTK